MGAVCGVAMLAGLLPLFVAWRVNRRTTLRPALLWAAAAWLAWLGVWSVRAMHQDGPELALLSLSLTGCAGVAVLGARRPHVAAWNFVVGSLLAVYLLPLLPALLGRSQVRLELAWLIFQGVVLSMTVVNYAPTRLGFGALLLGVGSGLELARLAGWKDGGTEASLWLIAASPWFAWAPNAIGRPATEADRLWRAFRDRFGLVWGQRQREQFNRAAANAGWGVTLTWSGLQSGRDASGPGPDDPRVLGALQAVLSRFRSTGPDQ
jgi:hypothetical protein